MGEIFWQLLRGLRKSADQPPSNINAVFFINLQGQQSACWHGYFPIVFGIQHVRIEKDCRANSDSRTWTVREASEIAKPDFH